MADDAEFYVGYLRMPPGLVRLLRVLISALLAGSIALAFSLSRSQHDPGDGIWHSDAESLVGVIAARPYPMLRVETGRSDRPVETVLLVSEGKHGGGERAAKLDGHVVAVRGTLLQRDCLRLLELADGDAIVPQVSVASMPHAAATTTRRGAPTKIILQGEIIDPKCYSGAMKPGEGKTHKECATLCIAGGIPPMFVAADSAGANTYFLLTNRDGGPLDERILPFVADLVEITGIAERRDDLQLLKIDPADIHRL